MLKLNGGIYVGIMASEDSVTLSLKNGTEVKIVVTGDNSLKISSGFADMQFIPISINGIYLLTKPNKRQLKVKENGE